MTTKDLPVTSPTTAELLTEPHHDTGPAHLVGERREGAELTARLWVPAPRAPERVVLRQVVDGEPAVTDMERVSIEPGGAWWEGPVRLVNQVNRYRFLLLESGADRPWLWYQRDGLAAHDVPDATDFQVSPEDGLPQWVPDAVAYQVFPDRYAVGAASARVPEAPEEALTRADADGPRTAEEAASTRTPPSWAEPRPWLAEPPVHGRVTGRVWYGGDLDGVAEHLSWIQDLGADTVYLTPVFPADSTHRYDASSFERVDELLGGDEALARLAAALHERGMHLVLDLTTNHTGATHDWFRAAVTDPDSTEARFYSFEHHPDVYATWLGVPSLPKLDHSSPELRDRLVRGEGSVTARWLLPPYEADGWRTDVANMTGRHGMTDLAHQAAADMRATMAQVERRTGRETWLVAEHFHDASADLTGPGWHGAMNYMGLTRPLWAWLSAAEGEAAHLFDRWPTPVPHLPGDEVVAGARRYASTIPPTALERSMNLLGSHDTPRVRSVVGSHELQMVAATALFTVPGVPTVFSGDELGATGTTGEHSRTTIPWVTGADGVQGDEVADHGAWGEVDREVLAHYRGLARRRRETPALRRGGLRWVHAGADLLVWQRTHPDGDVLVAVARDAAAQVTVPLAALPAEAVGRVKTFGAVGAVVEGEGADATLVVSADGPGSVLIDLARTMPPTL